MSDYILEVKDLRVQFKLDEGLLKAVDGVNFSLRPRRTLGIVGESGCGKSVTSQALLRIVPKPGKITGNIFLNQKHRKPLDKPLDLVTFDPNSKDIRDIRGGEIGMIFQEPMKAFSPIHTIGNQIIEGILIHNTDDPKKAEEIAVQALRKVGMSNPEQRFNEYPHQLSGGMRQRAMIAMALSCNPGILIADEPTTALDVTIQAQVLELINELKMTQDAGIIFITHDLGVIAEMSDEVAVMYLGKIVEYAPVRDIFYNPQHPYTKALLQSIPSVKRAKKTRLTSIKGTVPFPMNLKPGCGFYSRCPQRMKGVCNVADIDLFDVNPGHQARCLLVSGAGNQAEKGVVAHAK